MKSGFSKLITVVVFLEKENAEVFGKLDSTMRKKSNMEFLTNPRRPDLLRTLQHQLPKCLRI